mmetsp:Transcript_30292/g.71568  ORF Transcript_30292/g.71568 Transcript_30292/m.71568 type:complete len:124 (-) Transcript_30292:124-495(-)
MLAARLLSQVPARCAERMAAAARTGGWARSRAAAVPGRAPTYSAGHAGCAGSGSSSSTSAGRPLEMSVDSVQPADKAESSQHAGLCQAGKPVLVLGAASPETLLALSRMGFQVEHRLHDGRPR